MDLSYAFFDIADGGDGEATVVGIADSEEYAPALQPPKGVNRDAGVLVVFHDGALKWRPFRGNHSDFAGVLVLAK